MKVILPSLGILGLRSVDIRQVRYSDIRALHSFNTDCEALAKYQFVRQLFEKDYDLSKMTKYDLDYLYTVVALSISTEAITYDMDCLGCGRSYKSEFQFYNKEIVTVDKKVKLPQVRRIDGVDYSFTLLSAQDELDALEYALTQDDFDSALIDARVCFILGKSLVDIELIRSLGTSIYLAAFLFQQCCFHGFENLEESVCPHCGHKNHVRLGLPISMVSLDLESLMTQYTHVSDLMTFDNFMNFTIPEFTTLIKAVNEQVK